MKPDNKRHPTPKLAKFGPLNGFKGDFIFFRKIKILVRYKISKMIYFESK